jgi:hypothetical protein
MSQFVTGTWEFSVLHDFLGRFFSTAVGLKNYGRSHSFAKNAVEAFSQQAMEL